MPELLSTGDVAKLFRVSRPTVARWVGTGKLPAFKTPGGHRRIRSEDVERLLREEER